MWGRPTEDDENPCYRPSGASVHGDSGVFTKLLERAVEEDGEERGLDLLHRNMEDDLDIISQSTMDTIYSISRPEGQHKRQLDAYTRSPAHIRSPGPSSYEEHLTYRLGRRTVVDSVLRAKRKRTSSGSSGYSDLHAPTKRERSSQAANDTSFVLSDKAEPIKTFFPKTGHSPSSDAYTPPSFDTQTQPNTRALEARIVALEDELYGPRLGAETPRSLSRFIDQLDMLLAGTGFRRRLPHVENLNHQSIADFLGAHGCLSARVLNMLRMSEIHTLNLTPSLMDQSGLNLDALDLLRVFTKPNSFLFLAELDLGGSILRDSDITHIHHLPRVSTLMLNDTEISDEAVFHLVRLRRTLLNLDLAGNMRVTDDAAAPLLRLHRLRSLSLIETGVGMSGLRKFASSVRAEGREIDVEFPHGCEVYINRIQHHYLIDPAPPLIRDPGACASLSIGALRRNLAAHAECNPMILVGGTKEEMEYRLQDVLERRQADLKVREVMWREREETTADESDDYED